MRSLRGTRSVGGAANTAARQGITQDEPTDRPVGDRDHAGQMERGMHRTEAVTGGRPARTPKVHTDDLPALPPGHPHPSERRHESRADRRVAQAYWSMMPFVCHNSLAAHQFVHQTVIGRISSAFCAYVHQSRVYASGSDPESRLYGRPVPCVGRSPPRTIRPCSRGRILGYVKPRSSTPPDLPVAGWPVRVN